MRSYLLKTACLLISVASLLILTAHSQAQVQSGNAKTVWDGVFSEDQPNRGRPSYNVSCASCHRPGLSGFEGVLRGERFMDHWREDRLESLYSNIQSSMPRNNPGSLDAPTYVDIVAY